MFCKILIIMKLAFPSPTLIMLLTGLLGLSSSHPLAVFRSISYTSGMELTLIGSNWNAILNWETLAVNGW